MRIPPVNGLAAFLSVLALVGCGSGVSPIGLPGTYCQTGPKYGTRCYAAADVEADQRQQGRAPASEDWSERWGRLRGRPVGATSISSAPGTGSGNPGSGPTQKPQKSVRVSFVGAVGESETAAPSAARRRAARDYVLEVADWLEEIWVDTTQRQELPCPSRGELRARVQIDVSADGRVAAWRRSSEPSMDDAFERVVELALEAALGRVLPSPPSLFPDLTPRSLDVELSTGGLPCTEGRQPSGGPASGSSDE